MSVGVGALNPVVAIFGLNTELSTAVIAVLVAFITTLLASPVRYFVDRRLQRTAKEAEYEFEQRKKLRNEIGSYHGRLLEAGSALHYRLIQIYDKRHKRWLNVSGRYRERYPRHYFFNSTVYRFMAFAAVANRFEREAIYIDSRFADPTDRLFVFYIKALRWALTDTALFDGLEYGDDPTDHFYTDHLRRMCASLWKDNGEGLQDLSALEDTLATEHELEPVLVFFDGLDPDDASRLRWDRLAAFQVLLMAFIETFGYEIHKSEERWFDAVAGRMRREVATNLLDWLPKLGIEGDERRDPGGRLATAALRKYELPSHTNRLRKHVALPPAADPQV